MTEQEQAELFGNAVKKATNSGKEGYFWMSYYDKSLAYTEQVYVFDFVPTSEYQYNYQYDGSCGLETVNVASGEKTCAIYDVKGLTSSSEKIKAVGVGVVSTDMSGTAYIYKNPTAGNPVSGELVATQNFTTSYAGYYTIPLTNAPTLNKGESFSVVIKWNQAGEIFVDSTYTNGNWIGFTANTSNDSVNVDITSTTSSYFWFFTQATYTATITATASNTTVKTVQFSTNNGSSWKTGTSFSSTSNPTSFLIRVTDADGDVYNFAYSNGVVTAR